MKKFRICKNEKYNNYRIEELWDKGIIRSPFKTKQEAREREFDIAKSYGWDIKEKGNFTVTMNSVEEQNGGHKPPTQKIINERFKEATK